jgi:dihydroorotase
VAGPVFDLVTTMSKFLALGLSLSEVVRMTTAAPARAIAEADTIGTLRPGAAADVTLLRIESGSFTLTDSHGGVARGGGSGWSPCVSSGAACRARQRSRRAHRPDPRSIGGDGSPGA